MNYFERNSQHHDQHDVEDYSDTPYYTLLKQLPQEIASRCIERIEKQELNDEEAIKYVEELIERRREAMSESVISDPMAASIFEGQEDSIYKDIETSIFSDPENHLGAGRTARVKSCKVTKGDAFLPMAVKYVVTPTEKTLSASGEHDVILEVERMQEIEKIELVHENRSKYIRVPHPYFHHKGGNLQCYGMELIEGANLKQIMDGDVRPYILDGLRESQLFSTDAAELDGFIERFFATMHEYCLHGDIKPANIMFGTNGVIYVIDFGQSVLANEITEKAKDQFEQLKEDEVANTKIAIKEALRSIQKNENE